MIAIRLPNLSDRLGRPVFAMVEQPPWMPDRTPVLPESAVVIDIPRAPARLMVDIPAELTMTAWNEWLDQMLAAAIREPVMSAEDLEIRGPDREDLAQALLRLWGWLADHADDQCPAPEHPPGGPRCPHYSSMPNRALQNVLQAVSLRLRIPPHELIAWRFDELMLAFRTLQTESPETALQDISGH